MELNQYYNNSTIERRIWTGEVNSVISVCAIIKLDFSYHREHLQCHPSILHGNEEEVQGHFQLSMLGRSHKAQQNKVWVSQGRPYSEYIRLISVDTEDDHTTSALILEDLSFLYFTPSYGIKKFMKPDMLSLPYRHIPEQEPCTLIPFNVAQTYLSQKGHFMSFERKQVQDCVLMILPVLFCAPTIRVKQALEENYGQERTVLQETVSTVQAHRDNLISVLVKEYIAGMKNDPLLPLRHCHRKHNRLVHNILVGLQESLHEYVKDKHQEERKTIVHTFLEKVFHVNVVGKKYLSNHLDYRTAMYNCIKGILGNNGLRCSDQKVQGKEISTHAPLPLLILILWRVQQLEWDNFDCVRDSTSMLYDTLSQLQLLTDQMRVDMVMLEEEYQMTEDSPKISVALRKQKVREDVNDQMPIDDFVM